MMKVSLKFLSLVILLVVAVACGDSNDDDTSDPFDPDAYFYNVPPVDDGGTPVKECVTDLQCTGGQLCVAGKCFTPSDKKPGDSDKKKACVINFDCSAGEKCSDGICQKTSSSDSGSGGSGKSKEKTKDDGDDGDDGGNNGDGGGDVTGSCTNHQECKDFYETEYAICVKGSCMQYPEEWACTADSDCAEGQHCNKKYDLCEAKFIYEAAPVKESYDAVTEASANDSETVLGSQLAESDIKGGDTLGGIIEGKEFEITCPDNYVLNGVKVITREEIIIVQPSPTLYFFYAGYASSNPFFFFPHIESVFSFSDLIAVCRNTKKWQETKVITMTGNKPTYALGVYKGEECESNADIGFGVITDARWRMHKFNIPGWPMNDIFFDAAQYTHLQTLQFNCGGIQDDGSYKNHVGDGPCMGKMYDSENDSNCTEVAESDSNKPYEHQVFSDEDHLRVVVGIKGRYEDEWGLRAMTLLFKEKD